MAFVKTALTWEAERSPLTSNPILLGHKKVILPQSNPTLAAIAETGSDLATINAWPVE